MTAIKHPTISVWHRNERGDYHADIDGASLYVQWIPETPGRRGGFLWEAVREGQLKRLSFKIYEEPEQAMAEAEEAVRRGVRRLRKRAA